MYWEGKGQEYTEATVKLALEAAKERGIKNMVVATNKGTTAEFLIGSGLEVVCVTHVNGFKTPGENEMSTETRKKLEEAGMKVLTTTHVLSGAERAFSNKFGGVYPVEIMAHTLRMFGQGVKVCVEIATMALDAGMLPHGESIIAIGGSGRGADTCVIMKPAHAKDILDTWIEEIVCKPR